jgi:site-specific recombinase XerC
VNNPTSSEQHIGHRTPSTIALHDKDKPQPIRDWQQKYERYLFLIGRRATQERYARALERFLGKHRSKTYPHQFLRPVINDYVETRMAEGASVATVRLELSAIRGLFQFMLEMGAADVMFNPAKGVRLSRKEMEQRQKSSLPDAGKKVPPIPTAPNLGETGEV